MKEMSINTNGEPRNMRILCLNGFGTDSSLLRYMLKDFMNTFSALSEFIFMDGVRYTTMLPSKRSLDLGFKAPFRRYMAFNDGDRNKVRVNYRDFLEPVLAINQIVNDYQVDGFLCFSIGNSLV